MWQSVCNISRCLGCHNSSCCSRLNTAMIPGTATITLPAIMDHLHSCYGRRVPPRRDVFNKDTTLMKGCPLLAVSQGWSLSRLYAPTGGRKWTNKCVSFTGCSRLKSPGHFNKSGPKFNHLHGVYTEWLHCVQLLFEELIAKFSSSHQPHGKKRTVCMCLIL